jgi:hypothetical protein
MGEPELIVVELTRYQVRAVLDALIVGMSGEWDDQLAVFRDHWGIRAAFSAKQRLQAAYDA